LLGGYHPGVGAMKSRGIGLVSAAILVLSSVSSVLAQADVFIDVYACGMRDGNGAFVVTRDTQVVVTNNRQGNAKVTCQTDVTPSISGRAQQWDFDNTGVLCMTPSGATSSWHEVVSAQGEATLQCHTNPGNPWMGTGSGGSLLMPLAQRMPNSEIASTAT